MILSSKDEGAFCSQESYLMASQVVASNRILEALRLRGANGRQIHGWCIEPDSIELIASGIQLGIQFEMRGLSFSPVMQILLNTETGRTDIFAGKLCRWGFSGRRLGYSVPLLSLVDVINRQLSIGGSRHGQY